MTNQLADRVIVFDLDGTLVDSVRDLLPALNHTIATDGLPPLQREDVGKVVGKGAMAMIARAFALNGRELDATRHKELLKIFLDRYETHTGDHTVYFDGLFPALDALGEDGWRFAVCTNKFEHLARKLMQEIGGLDRFDALTGGDTFDFRKPDPLHIVRTVELAEGDPTRAIVVGDSDNDINAAKATGIPSVAVSFGYTETPPAELGADRLIDHFSELPQAVRELAAQSA